jgi:hypothetical protein
MSATTTEAQPEVFSIDFLSSIPEEALTNGPAARVYATQLAAQRAKREYEWAYERVEEDWERQNRAGHLPIGEIENSPSVRAARQEMETAQRVEREAQAEIGGIVFCVASDNIEKIESKLESLNRKAAKLGTDPISLTKTDETILLDYQYEDGPWDGPQSHSVFEHRFCVLAGPTPKVEGFEFLASIEVTPAGNVVKKMHPWAWAIRNNLRDEEAGREALEAIDLTRFRDTGNLCEHCHTERDRKDTFVVFNRTTGETKQVGRSCLRDYTGRNNPEAILKALEQYFEFFRSLSAPGSERVIPTDTYLAHCAAVIRIDGGKFIPRSSHSGTPTADSARSNFWNMVSQTRDRDNRPMWVEPTDADAAHALKVLNWARNEWDESSDFAYNVKTTLSNPSVPRKGYGIAAAVFSAYDRAQARVEQQKVEESKERGFIGEIKERITFTAKLVRTRWIEDHYSYDQNSKPLYIFEDEKGNQIKWFSSRDLSLVEDVPYSITATVIKHEDHPQYGKSTQVNRAKVQEVK